MVWIHQERSPITHSLSDLAPGKSARFGVTFRVTRPGQLCQHVEATAADGAHAAADPCVMAVLPASGAGPAPVTPSPGTTTVTPPPSASTTMPLEIRVSGPTASTVGKSAIFTAEITNPGRQPVTNVVVSQQADAALAVSQATEGAVPKGNAVVWSLPSLEPGRPSGSQVQCECKQPAARACCRFAAKPANGQSVEGQVCLEIAAVTLPAVPRRPPLRPQSPGG